MGAHKTLSTSAESPAALRTPSSSLTQTKILFRQRKSRKTSSESSPSSSKPAQSAATTPLSRNLQVLPRALSAEGEVTAALTHLRAADPVLARIIDSHGQPIYKSLRSPFHSLARSILYQQLAVKAAATIYSRFLTLCGGESNVLPEAILSLTPAQLRNIGVSGRKATYLHDLASKYNSGILSDSSIVTMDDKSLFAKLTMVKGIGAWSVDMFMISCLHRPDVLPSGDLAFRKGVQMLYGLKEVPKPVKVDQLCERWRPYRSVGAWYMWRLTDSKGTAKLALPIVPVIAAVAAIKDKEQPAMAAVQVIASEAIEEQEQPAIIELVSLNEMLPGL